MILIESSLKKALADCDANNVFDSVMQLQGQIYREQPGRRTFSFEANGHAYFAKLHFGIGWREIIKNLLLGKAPVLGANNEWYAIKKLTQAGIETLTAVGFGERGRNPATRQSFLITKALENTVCLETIATEWANTPLPTTMKRTLLNRLANITRIMQDTGFTHRDYYLCHFLMPKAAWETKQFNDDTPLYLIDLHRALQFKMLPRRWRLKDLAGLYFSSFKIPLTKTDKFRFIRTLYGENWKQKFRSETLLWDEVNEQAQALHEKFLRHEARRGAP